MSQELTPQPDRRDFLKHFGWLAAAGAGATGATRALAAGHGEHTIGPETMGVMVDLTVCTGCRACEHACKTAHDIPAGKLESYDDPSVYRVKRRPGPDSFTVLNSWTPKSDPATVYAKVNCLHCNHPSCVSACIVGALTKEPGGAVTYDAWKCIGCRYCMVACPFQIPAYEYFDAMTPRVRKCDFCSPRTDKGKIPACVEACPHDVMSYRKRTDLLVTAHEKLRQRPDRYVNHIYGEHEAGGTSWMYLSHVPFEEAGFLAIGDEAPPVLTEKIQHGVFKYWIAPVAWYGFLASMMWFTGRRKQVMASSEGEARDEGGGRADHARAAEGEEGAVAVLEEEAPAAPDEALVGQEPPTPALPRSTRGGGEDGHHAEPVRRSLRTPGVFFLLALVLCGLGFGLYRFIFGLGPATNLDQEHPWGLWIAMDVGSGIALAGGGFVTAALVHIFRRERYHAVARSALLTALLGYTFYVPGLLADIGRWYNIWHPTIPSMWQGNSVLFEVGLCVMIYLNVQYAELMPILCRPFMGRKKRFPRLAGLATLTHNVMEKVMPALLVLGVTLSTFHQSSLGNLMVIAPYKLHRLWWTPVSPVLFLLSAMMVGFPMVIFTMLFASWALKRKPEMHVLGPLARFVPIFLSLYLALKIGDMVARRTYTSLLDGSVDGISWIVEMAVGVVLPLLLLLTPAVRRSARWLTAACLMVILGVVLNRLNVFVIGYHPPFATKAYVPSMTEFAVSLGLVAALLLTYRVAVTYLPILEPRPKAA